MIRHGQVVQLGGRAGYQPDFRALACGEVSSARAALGLGVAEFAARLGHLVGWQPAPQVIESWERGMAPPPGDVVLAVRACAAWDEGRA
ncbi:MAG TPA: hypothetical protein VGM53_14695 [Streptosporangiaceae bacterium]|jgi:DNA-binding transcriptional regulator YiaG